MKKSIFITFLLQLFIHNSNGQNQRCSQFDDGLFNIIGRTDNCNPNNYRLVYEDNFNGNSLDLTFWRPLTGLPTADLELSYYQPENFVVSDGLLKIITKKENLGTKSWQYWDGNTQSMIQKSANFNYSSAWMESKFKFPYAYGKFEARVKITNSNSCRPAFWLYGNHSNEIDIFEFFEDVTKMSSTIHDDIENTGGEKFCHNDFSLGSSSSFANDFHIYSVTWTPWAIKIYLDNVLKWTYSRWATILSQDVECPDVTSNYIRRSVYADNPMVIKFNTKVSKEDDNLITPVQMEVDWVRVYYQLECKDITINNPDDIPQIDGMYNFLYGKNITINCNYNVGTNKPLALIGAESIKIIGNLTSASGTYFYTHVHSSSDCNGQSPFPLTDSNSFNTTGKRVNNIFMYPSPIGSDQILNFSGLENKNNEAYKIKIFNSDGRVLESGLIDGNYATYQINNYLSPGIYYVILTDQKSVDHHFKFSSI